jgi:outer membrane protein
MTENPHPEKKGSLNSHWIAHAILAAGLITLFYLHYNEKTDGHIPESQPIPENESIDGLRIAFVNPDVLMEQYVMVPEMVKTFEASTKNKEAIIREKQKEFEERVNDFQQRMQSGSISMEIAQITEQQLMKEQQELISLRDELSEQLAREEYEMNLQLLAVVSQFLEEYNKTRQYDLIFNYQQGTNLFIANQVYDITPEVVELLNQEYRLRKPDRK